MLERGGKAWRASLCLIVSDMLNLPRSQMIPLSQCVDFIHNSTLIHDDLEDNSSKRRGKPCTHLMFGVDRAVNAGSAGYFAPLVYLGNTSFENSIKHELIKATVEELWIVSLGQTTDIEWNYNDYIPTQDQYLRMICNKTAVLARLAVRYAIAVSRADSQTSSELIDHSNNIGISFQIVDDLINLTSQEYAKGRSYLGEDITEGKKTLIVIRAIQQNPAKAERLKSILNMKTKEISLINEALEIINSTDAIEYCDNFSKKIVEASWEKIDRRFKDSQAKQDLYDMTFKLINRKS
jgi:geranylgeranyl pyrophosphate synthase